MTEEPQYTTRKRFLVGLFIQSAIVNYLVIFALCTIMSIIFDDGKLNVMRNITLSLIATVFGMGLGYITIKKRGLEYFTVTEVVTVPSGIICPECGKDTEGVTGFCPWCGKKT